MPMPDSMKPIRLYLDNCCFNRPFDDQSQLTVRLETEAKLFIQEEIKKGTFELVWSYILELENDANPHFQKRENIVSWKKRAKVDVVESEPVLLLAENFKRRGLRPKDALHVACAVDAASKFFITTDRGIIKKSFSEIIVCSPIDYLSLFKEIQYE
jgi:predicted nucleic acid-binding protein